MGATYENLVFTQREIVAVQRMDGASMEAQAITEYLMRHGRLYWDDGRGVFWVRPPQGNVQIAVWLMPIAEIVVIQTQNAPSPNGAGAFPGHQPCKHS